MFHDVVACSGGCDKVIDGPGQGEWICIECQEKQGVQSYVGKIIGNQSSCCEKNRNVISSSVTGDNIYLIVQCKLCNGKWMEVLD